MRAILINLGILLAIFLAFYVDFFGWFVGRSALFLSFGLVIILFVVAWKVLGNPFAGDKKDGDGDED